MGVPVGLIAGRGRLPLELARCSRRAGRRVVAVGLRELASDGLAGEVDRFETLPLGQLEAMVRCLRAWGVRQVVLAGKVPKTFLWQRAEAVQPDAAALRLLASLADRADDSLLGAVVGALEAEGFQVLPQAALAPDLLAPEGPIGAHRITDAEWRDVCFAWPVARALGACDVGQTVVVRGGAVLALEAVEGTDAAIRRGCGLGEPGACVVKRAKPAQDPRFDVPAVGPETVRTMAGAAARVLAVEAAATLLVERDALVREADAAGIAVLGVKATELREGGRG